MGNRTQTSPGIYHTWEPELHISTSGWKNESGPEDSDDRELHKDVEPSALSFVSFSNKSKFLWSRNQLQGWQYFEQQGKDSP